MAALRPGDGDPSRPRVNSGMELYLSDTPASTSNTREQEAFLPPLPLILGCESPEYTDAGSALPLQLPSDGIWPGGGPCEGNNGLTPGPKYDHLMLGGPMLAGNGQLMHGGSFLDPARGMQNWLDHLDVTELLMDKELLRMNQAAVGSDSLEVNQPAVDFVNSLGMSQADVNSPGMSHIQVGAYPPVMGYSMPAVPAAGLNSLGLIQVSANSPELTPASAYPLAMDYLQPPALAADVQQTVFDNEMMELAKMVRVAEDCIDNDMSTMWSEDEDQHLLHGLARLIDENIATKCFTIANGLSKKTAVDVAYRIRWLEKKAVEQSRLGQKKFEGRATKGKVTKGAYKKINKYPLSEEAPNSKSTKDLIRDNDRLMDRIEVNLKTGQLENNPEYFYYVKTNMDAIQKKISGDVGNSIERLSIDQEAYEEVLRDRNSSTRKDATTPP